MTKTNKSSSVTMIAVEKINILNPRIRNQKVFFDIATNITKVGLKKPITITPSKSRVDGKEFDLVCGQGRLEAYIGCGQKEIPALIIDATEEQALIMSLVENLARRQHRGVELLQGIEILRKQGYDAEVIASKTGLGFDYVDDILNLMEKGEDRLLAAVEAGHMPISLAVRIAVSPEDEQHALQEAYETKQLRGNKLLLAKRLLDTRKRRGKNMAEQKSHKREKYSERKVSSQAVLKVYKREVDRKKLLARRANRTSNSLLFVKEALRDLLKEESFKNLLISEDLVTFPRPLADLLNDKDALHG